MLVDEKTRIRSRWFEIQLGHTAAEVLVEELWTVSLTIEALLEFENNISSFTSLGSVVLWKFHVHFASLRALAEGKGEVNLSGFPTMGGS